MANLILNLPFDELAGATTAYDYSQSRADGTVHNAEFVKGRNGNAIQFDGEGYVTVNGNSTGLNLATHDFTMLASIRVEEIECGTPKMLIFVFKFADGSFEEYRQNINAGSWVNIAIVRDGAQFIIYMNAQQVHTFTNGNNLSGFGVNQDIYVEYGFGALDDVKMYDGAMTQAEIISELSTSKQQAYYIDGINIKETFGVCISGSKGLLNRPKMKAPLSVSRDHEHGEIVFLDRKYLEPREITLSCFLKANGKNEFIQRVVEFEHIFDRRGGDSVSGGGVVSSLNHLLVDVHPIKPLLYEVYLKDTIDVDKAWNDSLMVGTFQLKLIEPCPVKRILKHFVVDNNTKTISVTLEMTGYLNIYWGDGSVNYDVTTNANQTQTITHSYAENGEYFIVIVGEVEDIKQFSTNAIVVWNRL